MKLRVHARFFQVVLLLAPVPDTASFRMLQGTVLFSDPNQNPFGTQSLDWGGNENDPSAKTVRLRDRLNEADTERRKAEEEALARERAAEMRREERLRKIEYMRSMPDNQPAGTGTYSMKSRLFNTPLVSLVSHIF